MFAVLAPLCAFGAVALLILGIREAFITDENPIQAYMGKQRRADLSPLLLLKDAAQATGNFLARLARRNPKQRQPIEELLLKAGNPIKADTIYAIRYGGISLGIALAILLGWQLGMIGLGIGAAIALLSGIGPQIAISQLAKRRTATMRKQVIDFADLFATMLQAGLPLLNALTRVSSEIGGPIGEEAQAAVTAIQAGESIPDALTEMAEKSGINELQQLIGTINQANTFGSPLAKVVLEQADTLRSLRKLTAEEKGGKAATMMMFGILGMLAPMIIMVILPMLLGGGLGSSSGGSIFGF